MKGDFSRWHYRRGENFQGVLPQQGRVLLDSDGTAQTRIVNDWQDVNAEDVIGSGVAAVPESLPDSFKVVGASVTTDVVELAVDPGRVWADGLLVHLPPERPGAPAVKRIATYFDPPVQTPPAHVTVGAKDAVVLEVWRESINAFQLPETLLEPALGGPDTAERVHTAAAFRLYHMSEGDTCSNIPIGTDFSKKGKLTVTLQPTVTIPGDCPVVETGGYTGFEHHLYRIEVADVPPRSDAKFKWSRFNGGLVGLGFFTKGTPDMCTITANLAAINTCGLSSFYLEAEQFNEGRGVWEAVYGAQATLNNSNQLVLDATSFGDLPASPPLPADPKIVFFRLWDGIKLVSAFTTSQPLEDGISLQFDPVAGANYSPRDYWTFQVRAGGIANPTVLIDSKPPEGIHYHRVPLGVITWPNSSQAGPADISDCRNPFHPLTRISSCCTYRVGDGIHSFGDFTTVQAAVIALPADGGEICVLPGTYNEYVLIKDRRNIRIHGCGPRSRIVGPDAPAGVPPVTTPTIHIQNSSGIRLDDLAVRAPFAGPGILIDSAANGPVILMAVNAAAAAGSVDIHLANLLVCGQTRSAIEVRGALLVEIRECDIRMDDVPSGWPGIFFQGDDGVIERNRVMIDSPRKVRVRNGIPVVASAALGGIQIAGTSDRVRIINNLVQGGIGNGITLGSVIIIDPKGNDLGTQIGWVVNVDDPCNPCKPGTTYYPPGDDPQGGRTISAGPLTEIRIERNRIYDMGLNGIGVVAFFDPATSAETIDVQGLEILGNDIRRCLRRQLAEIPAAMFNFMGYGGIALASVEKLVVRDNVIENNGPRWIDPVCGIFVLQAEGAEIARNRIVNNGAASDEPATSAKPGQRGGIIIMYALRPVNLATLKAVYRSAKLGPPALRVEENTVIAPLGRALSTTALGTVAVCDNLLVTQGIESRRTGLLQLLVSTVYIGNLGRNFELTGVSYQAIRLKSSRLNAAGAEVMTSAAARYFASGQVQFNDNQVVLDMEDISGALALTSTTIISLDDVEFHDNQCPLFLARDRVLTNTFLFGWSVNAGSNRWEEPLLNALYSAITLGLMNVTAHNTATHCIVALANIRLKVDSPNVILLNLFSKENPCATVNRLLAGFAQAGG